jgi:predicted amidohydrolase
MSRRRALLRKLVATRAVMVAKSGPRAVRGQSMLSYMHRSGRHGGARPTTSLDGRHLITYCFGCAGTARGLPEDVSMRVALAQTDSSCGDVAANLRRANALVREAAANGADLIMFPELFVHGYPMAPTQPAVVPMRADDQRIRELATHGPDVAIGMFEQRAGRVYNSFVYCSDGRIVHTHRKLYLVDYLIWQESSHATPGNSLRCFDSAFGRMAALICNDAWQPALPWLAARDGASVLLVPAASAVGPGASMLDIPEYWAGLLTHIARMQQCWVLFANRVGEQDRSRFWGGSRVVSPTGEIRALAPAWNARLLTADIDVGAASRRRGELPLLADPRLELVHREVSRLLSGAGAAARARPAPQ